MGSEMCIRDRYKQPPMLSFISFHKSPISLNILRGEVASIDRGKVGITVVTLSWINGEKGELYVLLPPGLLPHEEILRLNQEALGKATIVANRDLLNYSHGTCAVKVVFLPGAMAMAVGMAIAVAMAIAIELAMVVAMALWPWPVLPWWPWPVLPWLWPWPLWPWPVVPYIALWQWPRLSW